MAGCPAVQPHTPTSNCEPGSKASLLRTLASELSLHPFPLNNYARHAKVQVIVLLKDATGEGGLLNEDVWSLDLRSNHALSRLNHESSTMGEYIRKRGTGLNRWKKTLPAYNSLMALLACMQHPVPGSVKEPNLEKLARGRVVYEPPRYMSVNTGYLHISCAGMLALFA
eukprot:scaffold97944_cov16-Tisochrysis_lutea.AAC.2